MMVKKITRRLFLFLSAISVAFVVIPVLRKMFVQTESDTLTWQAGATGNDNLKEQAVSHIYVAKNGTPQQNVAKVIEMMGGIERFIGKDDIVILKPNCQWWNQGRTNLAAMKGFIDLVFGISGFRGEIVIAENHHFMDDAKPDGEKDNIRGWNHLSEINGDIDGVNHSMSSLVELFQKNGYKNVTKCHWRDGGPKLKDSWGNGQNGGIVKGPHEGDGYVWTDLDYEYSALLGLKKWKVKMTYPIFTSKYSGITIDLKNGAYIRDGKEGGRYLPERPVRLINFAVLNDHGKDTGITSSLKNYMGITDLSCGDTGLEPRGYRNVHYCGGVYFEYAKAGPIAYFIKTIKKADLNIVTAEWVGWGHRTDISKATRFKTILAATDPVALDYYGAKYIVYPLSKNAKLHDPDNPGSSIYKFLQLAHETIGEGTMDENRIEVKVFDYQS